MIILLLSAGNCPRNRKIEVVHYMTKCCWGKGKQNVVKGQERYSIKCWHVIIGIILANWGKISARIYLS